MVNLLSQRRAPVWLGAVLLCGLTLFIYRPAWHGGFIWDDDRYVTNNALLIAPDGLRRIWFSLEAPSQYFPLSYSLLRLERAFWDLNPTGYHLMNIFLHVANALLLWWILLRLKLPGAWLAAAIFAVHPIQVESVAWISEFKNVLMAFFFLLTLTAWVEYMDDRGRGFYVLAVGFYLLALFAKSTACTLPAALLLILWLKKKPIRGRQFLEVTPFVLLAIAVGMLAVWWEKYHQGTRTLPALAPLDRMLIASRAVWFYLSKIFWPSNLTFIYPQWKIDVADLSSYFWLALCFLAGVLIYLGRRTVGRGPEVAALFFVTTLGPLLGFVMLYTFRYTFVADHYQYLACIGPIALVAGVTAYQAQRDRNLRVVLIVASAAVVLGLSFWTARQTVIYRDLETLWRDTIAKNPGGWMAYNNLGAVQFQKGAGPDAVANYKKALSLNPDYPEAHYNLGAALLQEGKVDEAIRECELALKLEPSEPDAHIVLGNAFLARDGIDQAIDEYSKALAVRPDNSMAHYNLGVALQEKGEAERAAVEFKKARELTSAPQH